MSRLNLETIDVHSLLRETVTICQSEINAKKLSLTLDLEAAAPHVQADLTRLQQVFLNVLKNAIKFTDPGGARDHPHHRPDVRVALHRVH